ncbi:MAG: flavin reductase family protein [Gemmobacter sp.]|nr:flavin reductase family protein [Gemmobacter sp.]
MRFDLDRIDSGTVYKLMAATVVPRPIGWVTTLNREGRVNAAPYSFFNVMGDNPPVVALGILGDEKRGFKDTARNILDGAEFVVNLVPEVLAPQMNITAVDAPAGVDELELAGLSPAPCAYVKPPRIAESPVSFECVNHSTLVTGPFQALVVGRVLAIHIADAFVKDAARGHVDTPGLDLVGRGFGATYIRTRDTYEMARPTWATFKRP